MSVAILGNLLIWLIVAIVAIAIIVYVVNWLYHRSSKELSFVRTGLFGEKVVINSGAFVLPFIHEVTPVDMNVLRMRVVRNQGDALITKDRMRVDIDSEFYVRVPPTREAVTIAAATLGRRTTNVAELDALLSGKFVSALRSVASEMTMVEMHERRGEYVARVKESALEGLAQNGLELESVAITDLDQTDLEFFNPSNRFDAEGLTKLIEDIEARRKLRNDIEQDSMILIRSRNLEAEKQALEIDRESETARLNQERDIEMRRAVQRAELTRERSLRDTEAEQAQISAREEVEKTRIAHERALAEARIASERDVRQREIERGRLIDEAEIAARERVERARIAQQGVITDARIARQEEDQRREIERARSVEHAEIAAREETEKARIAQELAVTAARIARDEDNRRLEIERARNLEQAEIAAREIT
ncbi:MAG: flotillin family protein, partial [Hyphomicrobiales bacterium]|nr:flotillin family protein [Hyphomicrobiales bacterium]